MARLPRLRFQFGPTPEQQAESDLQRERSQQALGNAQEMARLMRKFQLEDQKSEASREVAIQEAVAKSRQRLYEQSLKDAERNLPIEKLLYRKQHFVEAEEWLTGAENAATLFYRVFPRAKSQEALGQAILSQKNALARDYMNEQSLQMRDAAAIEFGLDNVISRLGTDSRLQGLVNAVVPNGDRLTIAVPTEISADGQPPAPPKTLEEAGRRAGSATMQGLTAAGTAVGVAAVASPIIMGQTARGFARGLVGEPAQPDRITLGPKAQSDMATNDRAAAVDPAAYKSAIGELAREVCPLLKTPEYAAIYDAVLNNDQDAAATAISNLGPQGARKAALAFQYAMSRTRTFAAPDSGVLQAAKTAVTSGKYPSGAPVSAEDLQYYQQLLGSAGRFKGLSDAQQQTATSMLTTLGTTFGYAAMAATQPSRDRASLKAMTTMEPSIAYAMGMNNAVTAAADPETFMAEGVIAQNFAKAYSSALNVSPDAAKTQYDIISEIWNDGSNSKLRTATQLMVAKDIQNTTRRWLALNPQDRAELEHRGIAPENLQGAIDHLRTTADQGDARLQSIIDSTEADLKLSAASPAYRAKLGDVTNQGGKLQVVEPRPSSWPTLLTGDVMEPRATGSVESTLGKTAASTGETTQRDALNIDSVRMEAQKSSALQRLMAVNAQVGPTSSAAPKPTETLVLSPEAVSTRLGVPAAQERYQTGEAKALERTQPVPPAEQPAGPATSMRTSDSDVITSMIDRFLRPGAEVLAVDAGTKGGSFASAGWTRYNRERVEALHKQALDQMKTTAPAEPAATIAAAPTPQPTRSTATPLAAAAAPAAPVSSIQSKPLGLAPAVYGNPTA